MKSGTMPGWLNAMMGAGLLGALTTVAISVPTAARLARLEVDARGELPPVFYRPPETPGHRRDDRGDVWGLIALFAGTLGDERKGQGYALHAVTCRPL